MAVRLLWSRSASTPSVSGHVLNGSLPSTSGLLSGRICLANDRTQTGRSNERCYFTATQAAAALRPFYFAVHPDLFGLYPEMYKTNEQSLKVLNGYIDGLYAGRSGATANTVGRNAQQPRPVSLKFYVRDRKGREPKKETSGSSTITSVEVNLKERDPCAAVRKILESCNLPTEHLPPPVRLPWRRPEVDPASFRRREPDEPVADDEELIQFWASSRKKKSSIETDSLRSWLMKMAPRARRLRSEHEAMAMDVKLKIDEIKDQTGLTDIDFNLSWTLAHCRGCLQLFRKALTRGGIPVVNLKGWILKFARHGTYVSLDRSIVLGVDDLPSDWVSLIHNLNPPQAYYGDLPRLEKHLSQLLGNATITGSSDTPIREYKNRLITLTNRLSSYDQSKIFADDDWSKLCFVIENEACAMILLENGKILVPFTVLPTSLFEFLKEHRQLAINSMESYRKVNEELKSLRARCIQKWKLDTIEWGDTGNLSQHAVKACLERLESAAENDNGTEELRAMLQGQRLHIGPQEAYIVLPDGRLSIPCDWRL